MFAELSSPKLCNNFSAHHLIRLDGLPILAFPSGSLLPMLTAAGPAATATRSFDEPLKSFLNIAFIIIINKHFFFSRFWFVSRLISSKYFIDFSHFSLAQLSIHFKVFLRQSLNISLRISVHEFALFSQISPNSITTFELLSSSQVSAAVDGFCACRQPLNSNLLINRENISLNFLSPRKYHRNCFSFVLMKLEGKHFHALLD